MWLTIAQTLSYGSSIPDAAFLPIRRRVPPAGGCILPYVPRLFYLEMTMTIRTFIRELIAALALFTILGGLPLILWGLQ